MFQSDQSSLAQILQGGNQTITSIMDKAIQIGRDMSNKQLSQERDLLAMRQQETNLMQRRAENTQQDIEDSRRFARGVFESNRNYGLNERQENRASAQQLFSQGIAERGAAVSEGGLRLREQELNMRGQEAEQRQADIENERSRIASRITPTAASQQTSGTALGPVTDQNLASPASLFGRPEPTATPEPISQAAPKLDQKQATLRASEISRLLRNPAVTESQRSQLEGELYDITQTFPTQEEPLTAPQKQRFEASQAAAQRAQQSDETKKIESRFGSYLADTQAFPLWDEKTEAGAMWNKNRSISEIASAESYDNAEDYIAGGKSRKLGNLSPELQKKRREFWELVQQRKRLTTPGTTSTPAAPGAAPSDVDTYLDKKL